MSVEFRSVYAGKFNFIANLETTCSTHTSSVNHDRVHADDCVDTKLLSKKTDKFHHDHRSDCNTDIIALSFVSNEIFQSLCYHTGTSIRSVICCNIKVGNSCKFFFKNNHILCFGTKDYVCSNTMLVKPFYLRINRCCTNTSGYEYHFLFLKFFDVFMNKFRRTSQRSYKVTERISSF